MTDPVDAKRQTRLWNRLSRSRQKRQQAAEVHALAVETVNTLSLGTQALQDLQKAKFIPSTAFSFANNVHFSLYRYGLVAGHACLDSIVNTVLSFINHVHVSLFRCGLVSAYADLWFGCQCLCSNMPVSCFCSHCNVVTCVKAEMRLFCLHTCLSQQWTSCTTLDISALKRAYSSLKHRSLSSSVPKTQRTLHVKLRLLPLVLRPPPDLALPCWKRCSVIVL